MTADILEYSSDAKHDLTMLKKQLLHLSEIQKDISGLVCAINRVDSIDIEDIGTEQNEISDTFDRIHRSAMEDQYTHDEAERIINAVNNYIQNQEEGMDLDDSELLVTETIQSYLDPLTKAIIKEPVKSTTCKHIYEKSTILRHLQRNPRCPYGGCTTILTKEDIVDDLETKRKLMTMR
ncbi:hypothetical protein JTE90_012882 [Oedothorax gibbosus]|uniref:E3 SUMO-protein ligase NSE2 n=1 Tax=Oedothorax gibbosus TaxID=931172 RepID=A0AAV6U852_9ARAC|nr:hypothetical protein JTE90_012882 [Oedothorax gibbosus]